MADPTFLPDTPLVSHVHPSPNVEDRRGGRVPDLLLLHYTGMPSAKRAVAWLSEPASKVSCHYVVDEEGRVTQMVPERLRAWHAGVSSWQGVTDINSCSIGVEIHNLGHDLGYPDFPRAQMEAVARLCRDIIARHAIAPRRVLAHSDVAPRRKRDPGEKFDWAYLHSEGIGHFVPPSPIAHGPNLELGEASARVREFQSNLKRYGYGIEVTGVFDKATETVTAAFQRHFRQSLVDGVADLSTIETLERLLAALPTNTAS